MYRRGFRVGIQPVGCVKLVLSVRYMVSSSLPMRKATEQIEGQRRFHVRARRVGAPTIPQPSFPGITRNGSYNFLACCAASLLTDDAGAVAQAHRELLASGRAVTKLQCD